MGISGKEQREGQMAGVGSLRRGREETGHTQSTEEWLALVSS